MPLRRYFKILELPETANQSEIRKQYRKLAMRLHPDKNPSPQAKDQFLLVSEAYEILIGRKAPPTLGRVHISKSKEKTHEERIREARIRHEDQLKKERLENELYFRNLFIGRKWKILKVASVLGCFISLLIILDLFLPSHYEEDKIEFYARNIQMGNEKLDHSLVRTEKGSYFWISGIDYTLYNEYPSIYIEKTRIFHQPIQLISIQKIKYAYFPVKYTFYSVAFIVILFMLIPMLIRVVRQKKVWYTVLYHLALYVSSGLILIFLFSNDHWAHLLTFGLL
jgi:hypothetical protein